MRCLPWLLLVASACGGPTQSQLAETPTARSRPTPVVAPPASTSDRDRAAVTQQFDDMEAAQRAHGEARAKQQPPPRAERAERTKPAPPPPPPPSRDDED